jgi:hypothetical protein
MHKWLINLFKTLMAGAVLATTGNARAQNDPMTSNNLSRPTIGGTLPDSATPRDAFGASGNTSILRHRDFAGKPCLDVQGYARPHVVDHNLYDHVIDVTNSCPQRISIKVCYYQTDECIPLEIAGHESKEAVLGTLPAQNNFGFEFREKF